MLLSSFLEFQVNFTVSAIVLGYLWYLIHFCKCLWRKAEFQPGLILGNKVFSTNILFWGKLGPPAPHGTAAVYRPCHLDLIWIFYINHQGDEMPTNSWQEADGGGSRKVGGGGGWVQLLWMSFHTSVLWVGDEKGKSGCALWDETFSSPRFSSNQVWSLRNCPCHNDVSIQILFLQQVAELGWNRS